MTLINPDKSMDRPINLDPALHNFQAKCNQNVDAAMHIYSISKSDKLCKNVKN